MSDAISKIGEFFNSGAGKATETGAVAGTGLLQNWLANREAQKKQKFVEDLISNPTKFNTFVSGFEKPLTAGLTADVARETDAYGAERGLGSSPAVMKDVYAQALAPILAQQKDEATRTALQSLGIYEQSPTTKPVDISSILKALMMGGAKPPGSDVTAGIDLSKISTPTLSPDALGISTPLPSPSVSGGDTTGLF